MKFRLRGFANLWPKEGSFCRPIINIAAALKVEHEMDANVVNP